MKRIVVLTIVLLLTAGLSACGGKKEMDINAFVQQVMKTVEYDDNLIEPSERAIRDFYGFPLEGLEQYVIYVSGTMSTANELAVMKLGDHKAVEAAKQAVTKRLADQRSNYENYNPEELFRLDKALIEVKDNYLLFSVSNDNDTVKKLFTDSFR